MESTAGAGFSPEVLSNEGREGGRRKRETNRFFIFAFQAYLMIFPQTDRQTQRETYRGHTWAIEIVHTPKSGTQPVVITIE